MSAPGSADSVDGADGGGAPRIHSTDPAPLLEAAFRRIETNDMAGVPMLNPALRVEAIGFDRWQGHWLGILITPWFMNLVLVPGEAASWNSVAPGKRRFLRFPSGDFAFLGSEEPELGEFQCCSLFSPMTQFSDQDGAREVGLAALAALRRPAETTASQTPSDPQPASGRPMSKREFLGAVFRRG
ncbi:MAG: [NiFe]-hydrogenase assembly chaperone HybE [Zoogloeaceae bacterium]|jgi:[NiFe] hydrogenase assembly HybE family chaperone|nr:[NiFe]-hydrogenase assembly chaperone HybE [Zoogloeaceae bacterium]